MVTQALYQQFLYLFVRGTLHAPSVASEPATYAAALEEAESLGLIVHTPSGTAAPVNQSW